MRVTKSDMRTTPALQVADVFAWSINKTIEEERIRFEWQNRLFSIKRDRDILDYGKLSKPLPNAVEKISS